MLTTEKVYCAGVGVATKRTSYVRSTLHERKSSVDGWSGCVILCRWWMGAWMAGNNPFGTCSTEN